MTFDSITYIHKYSFLFTILPIYTSLIHLTVHLLHILHISNRGGAVNCHEILCLPSRREIIQLNQEDKVEKDVSTEVFFCLMSKHSRMFLWLSKTRVSVSVRDNISVLSAYKSTWGLPGWESNFFFSFFIKTASAQSITSHIWTTFFALIYFPISCYSQEHLGQVNVYIHNSLLQTDIQVSPFKSSTYR